MPKAGFNPNVGLALCVLVLSASGLVASAPQPASMDWIHVVRIGAYGLQRNNAQTIVRQATESHVFGIEVDNDITGRYQSFLDPTEKLKAIRAIAKEAHRAGNRAFVYIAGTECITANADQTPHTLGKDHSVEAPHFGSPRATRMSGSVPTPRNGARSTWKESGRSQLPVSMVST